MTRCPERDSFGNQCNRELGHGGNHISTSYEREKMSFQHHGNEGEQSELMKRFMEQATGTAQRQYPAGRMGAEDDGDLTYAMANDDRHRTIVIRFPKPIDWIGLDLKAAEELRDQLTERIMALRGVKA